MNHRPKHARLAAATVCLVWLLALQLIGAGPATAAQEPPVIKRVSPDIGPTSGGTSVTIGGRGFTGATRVRFGDVAVPPENFKVTSDKSITAVSPAHAEGIVHVTVTTPAGTSATGDCGDSGEGDSSSPTSLLPGPCDKFNYYGERRGGAWATTGLQGKGGYGSATVLRNGKVLFTGPTGSSTRDPATGRTTVSGAELFDPATGRWSSCPEAAASPDCPGPMVATSSQGDTATLLKDGRVLIAGGHSSLRSAEIYDPATGKFTKTGDLSIDRAGHTATLLPDGRVLVAGGDPNANLQGPGIEEEERNPGNSAEIYNPATGQWTDANPMAEGVESHTATLLASDTPLANGKVLVAGGHLPPNPALATDTDTSQLYDPLLDVWTRSGPLVHGREGHSATVLADGRILAAGGDKVNGVLKNSTVELYDPQRGVWTETGRMGQARTIHVAARLPNGKVLVAGGVGRSDLLSSAELYDPASGTWSWAPFVPDNRATDGVTLPTGPWAACAANCGKVLVRRGDYDYDEDEVGDERSLLFAPTPEARAISPNSGFASGGRSVTITGTGLASVNSVSFGGVEAQRVEPDAQNPDGKLVAVAPAHAAGPVEVAVTTDGGRSAGGPRFTYFQDPSPAPTPSPDPGPPTPSPDPGPPTPSPDPGPTTPSPGGGGVPSGGGSPGGGGAGGSSPGGGAGGGAPSGDGGSGGSVGVLHPAKLEVARSRVLRGDRAVDVLAPITRRASGRVAVDFHAAGRHTRFEVPVDEEKGRLRFREDIPRAQAAMGTGIVTLSYAGNERTRGQVVRLRAASRHADLEVGRPTLSHGALHAQGTVSRRARGVVRVQLSWSTAGQDRTYEAKARIRKGRFELDEQLPQDVIDSVLAREGTVHSYTLFTGYLPARMRGEMQAYQVAFDDQADHAPRRRGWQARARGGPWRARDLPQGGGAQLFVELLSNVVDDLA